MLQNIKNKNTQIFPESLGLAVFIFNNGENIWLSILLKYEVLNEAILR